MSPVRAVGLHVDRAPEAGRHVQQSPGTERETRRCRRDHAQRRHHPRLPQRVLLTLQAAGTDGGRCRGGDQCTVIVTGMTDDDKH